MNSLLPNMRLLGMVSEHNGRDYLDLSHVIDEARERLGYDLAEESVYFFFSSSNDCRIARSVLGPMKETKPLLLWDWVSAPVEQFPLQGRTWHAIENETQKILSQDGHSGKKLILKLGRRVEKGVLSLSFDGFVHD